MRQIAEKDDSSIVFTYLPVFSTRKVEILLMPIADDLSMLKILGRYQETANAFKGG